MQEWTDKEGSTWTNELPAGEYVSHPEGNGNGNYKVTVTEECANTCFGYHVNGVDVGACTDNSI